MDFNKIGDTPFIPEQVYDMLPELLKETCSKFSDKRERDVFLTSAITVFSGCLPNLRGMYGMNYLHPNLFSIIVAPPASGKGVMNYARTMGEDIQENLLKKDEKGNRKMLFIPADISSAMIVKQLSDNGGRGIIYASEADTLSNSMNQDWGNFSDKLRQGFHHETIELARKLNNEYIRIANPCVSMLLSGTPEQVRRLIPSVENGLFSRNIFYAYSPEITWKDNTPCKDCNNSIGYFQKKAKDVEQINKFYENTQLEFSLSEDQWDSLNKFYKQALETLVADYGEDAKSLITRMAIIQFRLAMILTGIRNFENEKTSEGELVCSEQDFDTSMTLAKTYLQHSLVMLEGIPGSGVNQFRKSNDKFTQQIPESFKREEAITIGKSLGLSERSVDRQLERLVKEGAYHKPSFGVYQKIA
ncbi:MAG: DUF3987 domain-containing protein [Pseudobacter sp.]|uniref:DUF3987 domain-containing protein n=1 Tax=Pseudobacter sp. TaxID=2045420 RepID=UPI003F80F838